MMSAENSIIVYATPDAGHVAWLVKTLFTGVADVFITPDGGLYDPKCNGRESVIIEIKRDSLLPMREQVVEQFIKGFIIKNCQCPVCLDNGMIVSIAEMITRGEA